MMKLTEDDILDGDVYLNKQFVTFAGLAMQALINSEPYKKFPFKRLRYTMVARDAFSMAKEMIAVLQHEYVRK